jgi:signal transduction histidine kinase
LTTIRFWKSWAFVGLLAALCVFLEIVQYRWIYQVSVAERDRSHADLQSDLGRLSADFDRQLSQSIVAVTPGFPEISRLGTLAASSLRFQNWKKTNDPMIHRVGLLKQDDGRPAFYQPDIATGEFVQSDLPVEWAGSRDRLEALDSPVLEFPLYGSMHRRPPDRDLRPPPGPPLEDWMVVELNAAYIRSTLLPALLKNFLANSDSSDYDMQLVAAGEHSNIHGSLSPDASIGLLDMSRMVSRPRGPGPDSPPRQGAPARKSKWQLLIYRRGGSLDSLAASARWRNIALSGGILLLILITMVALVQYSRRAQHLAELQMTFVAGVSHELRTPLTVIRTAAFNLQGKTASRPAQVEQYGRLIQQEGEKLSNLVDQVLRHGAARAGKVIGEKHPTAAWKLIEASLQASLVPAAGNDVVLETRVNPKLPLILADALALQHALQNLLDNAVKYGLKGGNWIGISAEEVLEGTAHLVEIRVIDRGPGIPAAEQATLFDAFYRGESAVQDQVHGTGLGLNIAKSIIEAHGGTIRVSSEPHRGAEFVVRIPAAPEDLQVAWSNTTD